MKILSLFDGISVAQQALKELGIECSYYASEIDKYAISITQKNFPKTIQLGDVKELTIKNRWKIGGIGEIDLLIGGSPCQDLSIAKKNRQGLDGARSGLFWEYVRILEEVKPKYFVLENVNSMPKEAKQTITEALGVDPIMINAALVSAQNRKRLFWTNIPNVTQPEDRNISLQDMLMFNDVLLNNPPQDYTDYVARATVQTNAEQYNDKCPSLSASMGMGGGYEPLVMTRERAEQLKGKYIDGVQRKILMRKLTPIECERLQSLPDNYIEGVSNTQRYKALGNAFNCEVIKHILTNLL